MKEIYIQTSKDDVDQSENPCKFRVHYKNIFATDSGRSLGIVYKDCGLVVVQDLNGEKSLAYQDYFEISDEVAV